jgi:hypothetical protein
MRRKRERNPFRAFGYCILLLFLMALPSCSLFNWPQNTTDQKGKGAMLLRHDSWLYCIGGLDDSGSISASSEMATVDGNGAISGWQSTSSLPVGIHHGAAFAAGSLAYVIGGMTDSGLSSAIYYTLVTADGKLGFGTDDHWETNLRPLPEARAYAAWVLSDGWIFLIGGETPSGATKSIIRARIYQDGQVGQWYESSQSLPEARWGSAATVMGERLYIAGGANAHGMTSEVVSFALGEYGALSDRRIEPSLPLALQEAVLLADRDDLLLAGGSGSNGWSKKVYRNHGGIWAETSLTANVEGPYSGHAGASLYCLSSPDINGSEVARIEGLSVAPEAPVVVSGSGMVPNNSLIDIDGGPGLTVRYRKDSGTPTIADAAWPAASIKISSSTLPSMELSLAAFSSDGTVSPVVHRTYAVRAGGFFVMVEGTLQIHDSAYTGLDYRVMQESGSEGTAPTAASSLWYRMIIDTAGNYRLAWADADEDTAYSARLMVSVYEVDLYTEVPDLSEIPSRDRRGGLAAPLHLALNPGDYYVYIRDTDGREGRDFGLSLVKE